MKSLLIAIGTIIIMYALFGGILFIVEEVTEWLKRKLN